MENEEIKIENFLKTKISKLVPSRTLFQNVTKVKDERNTYMKAGIPSPYQLNTSFFMKKIAFVGIPLLVIAFLVINKMDVKKDELAQVDTTMYNESVDSIIDSFSTDDESDITLAQSEQDETNQLETEIDLFNNFKTSPYENNI